jgi:hypothetical protein
MDKILLFKDDLEQYTTSDLSMTVLSAGNASQAAARILIRQFY